MFLQVLVLCGIKVAVHALGLERISVNQLFSAMVASTVFLLGFLLNGVLTDFKESEKIPGELATSLQSLKLEIQAIQAYHPEARVAAALEAVAGLGHYLIDWFMERQAFYANLQEFIGMVKASRTRPGVAEILLPGELEWRRQQEKLRSSVPLDPDVYADLRQLASEVGVPWLPAA